MIKHTGEPWKLDEATDLPLAVIEDNEDGDSIIDMFGQTGLIAQANAERIVTCINACAGLSNEEVKRYGPEIEGMIGLLKEPLHILHRENADGYELLETITTFLIEWEKDVKDLLSRIEGKGGV